MAASSFGSTNIRVELDAATGSTPTWQKPTYFTVRHIPGSNNDVIQTMGYGFGTVAVNLLLTDAEWTSIQAQLLTIATLTFAGVSQGSCLLEALGSPVDEHGGYVTVQATFRKTSA